MEFLEEKIIILLRKAVHEKKNLKSKNEIWNQ